MTQDNMQRLWAYLLIGAGILFLLGPLGLFSWVTSWVWSGLFFVGGGLFLYYFNQHRAQWWALLPGSALIGLGLASVTGPASGTFFLGAIGAGFVAIYLSSHRQWWALIPGGVLLTLASVAWVERFVPFFSNGIVFFSGIALTFLLLTVLPPREGRQSWALYPALGALALVVMQLFSSTFATTFIAIALIIVGWVLLQRQPKPHAG